MGDVLVVAEHLHGKFPKTTLVSIAAGKHAASLTGGKCVAAVLAERTDALAGELAEYGVSMAPPSRTTWPTPTAPPSPTSPSGRARR
jgi:hypothetical protein